MQLSLPVPTEEQQLYKPVRTNKLILDFSFPQAQGVVVGPALLPGNGQLPWFPLGTQPGRLDSASLGYTSTLSLLGRAGVV